MLSIFKTLIAGANARAEEQLESKYSIELIRQKIRESDQAVTEAKNILVSLIQRERSEIKLMSSIETRIGWLTSKAKEALKADRVDLAEEAAKTIADLENERGVRQQTLDRLEIRITRLRGTVDQMSRRLLDLKQGEIAAKAIRSEAAAQTRLNKTLGNSSSFVEAEGLIERVMSEEDPFEQAEILAEVNADISGTSIDDRFAEAGIGKSNKTTAADVLARLQK